MQKGKEDNYIYILLLSHGCLAKELYNTAKLILGDVSDIGYLEYPAGQDLVEYKEKLTSILRKKREVLLLADLFGGSPFVLATQVFAEMGFSKHVEIFTGVNLPMLLEVATQAKNHSLSEIREMVIDAGKNGIVDFRKKTQEINGGKDNVNKNDKN